MNTTVPLRLCVTKACRVVVPEIGTAVQEEQTSWRTANALTHTPAPRRPGPRGTYRVPQEQPRRRHASHATQAFP